VTAITYISALDDSGYAQAAIAYVRGLVNAGVPVHWQQFAWPDATSVSPRMISHEEALARARHIGGTAHNDLVALVKATHHAVNSDVQIMHTIPEYFPRFSVANRELVGMTAWETSKIPSHWVSLCNTAHRLVVPSTHNQKVFSNAQLRCSVHNVAHIRRSRWSEFSSLELHRIRNDIGLDDNVFTFYCISTNDPRKNIRGLLENFCHAFTADQAVQLLIKTTDTGYEDSAPFAHRPNVTLIGARLREITSTLGRAPPRIRVIASTRLSQREIDALHDIGDCYVSFAHGEGWGLGAFDAATYGNPVLMPNWSGHLDFLPQPWRGGMPVQLSPAPVWPTHQPSMWNDQSWANVSQKDGVNALQDAFTNIEAHRADAQRIQGFIANEFSEARVTRRLLNVIDGANDA
jgi:hypothetical protein